MPVVEASTSWLPDICAETTLCDHILEHDLSVGAVNALHPTNKVLRISPKSACTASPFLSGSPSQCTVEIKFSEPVVCKFVAVFSTSDSVEVYGCQLDQGAEFTRLGVTVPQTNLSREAEDIKVSAVRLDGAPTCDYLFLKFANVIEESHGAPVSSRMNRHKGRRAATSDVRVMLDSIHVSTAEPRGNRPVPALAQGPSLPLGLPQIQDTELQEQLHLFSTMAHAILSPEGETGAEVLPPDFCRVTDPTPGQPAPYAHRRRERQPKVGTSEYHDSLRSNGHKRCQGEDVDSSILSMSGLFRQPGRPLDTASRAPPPPPPPQGLSWEPNPNPDFSFGRESAFPAPIEHVHDLLQTPQTNRGDHSYRTEGLSMDVREAIATEVSNQMAQAQGRFTSLIDSKFGTIFNKLDMIQNTKA